jgi:hypothetical protein
MSVNRSTVLQKVWTAAAIVRWQLSSTTCHNSRFAPRSHKFIRFRVRKTSRVAQFAKKNVEH